MQEPERLSMSTGLPYEEKIKKIPLPSITQETDVPQKGNGFWEFVAKHKKSREAWLDKQNNENNK